MLFNYNYFDKSDSSEDCLVAKVLLGLIFNPFVPANHEHDYELSRNFLRYYLDDRVDELDFANAEAVIKNKFFWFNSEKEEIKNKTAPDLLLLFPHDVVIAFEVKYTLGIEPESKKGLDHQLIREYEGLTYFQEKFKTKDKYLLFLIAHQRLSRHIEKSDFGLGILKECYRKNNDEFRVNTWNCVYKAVQDTSHVPHKEKILDFFKQKENCKTNHHWHGKSEPVRLIEEYKGEIECDQWNEWESRILESCEIKADNRGKVGRNYRGILSLSEILAKCKKEGNNIMVGYHKGADRLRTADSDGLRKRRFKWDLTKDPILPKVQNNWILGGDFFKIIADEFPHLLE